MIKKLFRNHPNFNSKGHYVFYDDSAGNPEYSSSNGLPVRNDKFKEKDLYTTVKEDDVNKNIVEYQLVYPGNSYIKIKEMKIENNGVDHEVVKNNVKAWIFDEETWYNTSGNVLSILNLPTGDYEGLEKLLQSNSGSSSPFNKMKFFDSDFPNQEEGASLGKVIDNTIIVENLSKYDGDNENRVYGEFNGDNLSPPEAFNINSCFDPPVEEDAASLFGDDSFTDLFTFNLTRQKVFIVVQMQGNAKAWYDKNDMRRKAFQIFSFDPGNLFNQQGGKVESLDFSYANSVTYTGHGVARDATPLIKGAEKEAWKCTSLKLEISTEKEIIRPSVPTSIEPYVDLVKPDIEMNLNNFDESFLTQKPNQAIWNLYTDYYGPDESVVIDNFEPVAITKITSLDDFDLQAYQSSNLDRQFCSAPGEISLDFYISDYKNTNYVLDGGPQSGTNGLYQINQYDYKFYVIDWDDVDDDYKETEDFINDIPSDIYELYKKRENDLYKFSDIGAPLYHSYSRPGIKTIKAVLFTHTLEGKIQVVRWKFIKVRIFLDIPVSQYPEFAEYGGESYKTIPWPITTPIIGGTDLSSNYQISINETLSSGKIGDTDIIDELFLVDAQDNDELGKSISEFDLEQVRYFNTGVYDMNRLLELDITSLPNDISPEYLETLPFPEYYEEFDINGDESLDGLDAVNWISAGRPDIADYLTNEIIVGTVVPLGIENGINPELIREPSAFINQATYGHLYWNSDYWDCRDWNNERIHCFPEESSVGQIFISDNLDIELIQDCKIELNCADMDRNVIHDSNGKGNQGILIGDYKIKKRQKGKPMRRDSFIKVPKKANNTDGAL